MEARPWDAYLSSMSPEAPSHLLHFLFYPLCSHHNVQSLEQILRQFIGSGKWTVSLNFPPQMRAYWLKWISPLVCGRIPAAGRWPLLFPSPPYKLGELAAKFMKSHGLMPFPCCPFTFETASFPLSKTVKTVFELQRIYFRSVWWKVSKYRDFLSCFSYFCFAANSIMKNWKEITLHCPIPF